MELHLKPKRTRRDVRMADPPAMRLTERDVAIIQAVAEYRVLRQDQIQRLFFGSRSTTQYRLAHLYQHGFLRRVFLPVRTGSSPTLYVVDRRGIEVLRAEYGVEPPKSSLGNASGYDFLAHTLAINDVRISISLACQQLGYTLYTWQDEASMKADYERIEIRLPTGKHIKVSLIPDSYFVIETPHGRAHFFLELDRGTMSTTRFTTKILAYNTYVESGAYQRRYQTRSLRVLTVTSSSKRLTNLKEATDDAKGGRLFWFTTLRAVTPTTVLHTPIWQVAGSPLKAVLIDAS